MVGPPLGFGSAQKKGHRTLGAGGLSSSGGGFGYSGRLPPAVERPPAQIGSRLVVGAFDPSGHTPAVTILRWLLKSEVACQRRIAPCGRLGVSTFSVLLVAS